MEQLYPLLTLFSGGTIVLLGSFLFASERELKRKRRELDELKRKPTAAPDTSTDGEHSGIRSLEEGKNDELLQEAAVLSNRTLDEHPNDRGLLLSAPFDQQLQEKIESLQKRLATSESELVNSSQRIHEAFDLNTKLQIEIAGLKQQVAAKDEAIVELQSRPLEEARMQSEKQELRAENQRLMEDVGRLQEQLRINEGRLNALSAQYDEIAEQHAQLQVSFAESRQRAGELTAENKQLQGDVDTISSKFAAAQDGLEEFRMLQHNAHLDKQRLLEANQQLEHEVERTHEQLETLELRVQEEHERQRIQLDASENRLQEMARQYQEVSDRCAHLEAEAADYRRELERRPWNAQTLESAREPWAVESRETSYQEQQQKLEALIADLERELSEGKSQVEALEETHERLLETERICQELGDENHRLRQEIERWQERLAASEENQRQVSMLRQQLDALQTEHARVMDNNRQMQEEVTADGPRIGQSSSVKPPSHGPLINEINDRTGNRVGELSSDLSASGEAPGQLGSSESAARFPEATQLTATQMISSWVARYWHYGAVFASVIIFMIAGAVAMKIMSSEAPTLSEPVALAPERTLAEDVAVPAAKSPIRAAPPRLRGAFQTVRPTQVFSAPSENSALIANIGEGMKLNVVDSRDGWLEIRSKHGRPPGFIRQEAAVRIGSN